MMKRNSYSGKRSYIILIIIMLTGVSMLSRGQQYVSFNFAQKEGKIKALNGINIGTENQLAGNTDYMIRTYAELKIPLTRLHDCQFSNPGVVDIPAIFPLFHLDADDPENYNFKKTDDYILDILRSGSKISYRLGVDIEHTKNKYHIYPPEDFDKWAKICVNIIRHYNDGWANGYHMNIQYWEIWNEPGGKDEMWIGDIEQYYKLYETTVKAIKKYDQEIKVGTAGLGPAWNTGPGLVKYCKEHNLPIDFFPWHLYTSSIKSADTTAYNMRKLLDDNKYKYTKIHLNEWNYYPADLDWFKLLKDRVYWKEFALNKIGGMEGAAFTASMLIDMQDLPIDQACYYSGDWTIFGLFDEYGLVKKPFFAYKAFSMLLNTPNRVKCEKQQLPEGMYAIGGVNSSNNLATIMLSNYSSQEDSLGIKISGLPWEGKTRTEIFVLDDENNLTPLANEQVIQGNSFEIKEHIPAPSVMLIRFYKVIE